jgi:2-oxoglutarate dehydrogenase complex dehydrogenase (E1) component-like enzyme
VHPKLTRVLAAWLDMVQGKRPVDWGCAEMLAFGSLLLEEIPVRLTGQDSERGTFSQRLQQILPGDRALTYAGRPEAGSPATGSHRSHTREQEELIKQALDLAHVGVSTWDHQQVQVQRPGGKEHGDGNQR